MMRRLAAIFLYLILALLSRAARYGAPPAAPQDSAAPVPEMIGEGVISTPDDELGGTITADGQTIYFEKSAAPHYLYILYESHLINGQWSMPTVLPFSGQYRDTDPVLSPDGTTLLFASDRPVNGQDQHHFYIWAATKTATGWNEPQLLPGPVNDGFNQVFASIASNGNIYFASSRKTGHYDIFRSRFIDGKYQPAEDLGPDFNGPTIDSFEAFISPDESFLLIGSFGREESFGSSDIYIAYNQNGVWTKPKNLGPIINTPARDYSPRLSGDGKWLLYTSERRKSSEPRTAPYTYPEFVQESRSLYNGLGNLYRIPLDYVLRTTKP
jgi:Tol biopolymer transport system component